jgi:diguanylate cyclase (GGDEF)-like protein
MFDLSLQGVIEALVEPGIDTVSPAIRQLSLFDNAAKATYLDRIFVLDAHGSVTDDSKRANPLKGNFSEQEYFTVQRDGTDRGLYVSKPFERPAAPGEWAIALSRRISAPDGSFRGVVVGILDVNYFEALFGNLNAGPLDGFGVLRSDGAVITRYPFRLTEIGRDLSQSELFQYFPASRSGNYEGSAISDGVKRLYAFGQVGNLPLVVSVASAESTVFQAWLQKALLVAALLAALAMVMAALAVCLVLEFRRRRATEQKLAAAAEAASLAASTDGLTGIANRRRFDETAETEWKRAIRDGEPLSILIADIDFFKAYNDTCGHLAGDGALKTVASCIQATLPRPSDFVARYGGEEFALLLPNTPSEGALAMAETIRTRIAGRNIPHPAGLNNRISVSIGITTVLPGREDSFSYAFDAADEALFRAKRLGRDRVAHSDRTLMFTAAHVEPATSEFRPHGKRIALSDHRLIGAGGVATSPDLPRRCCE